MWKTASRRSSPKCSKSSFWVVRGGGFIGRKESGMPHSFCMIHTTKGKKSYKRNLFLSPSLIFLIGKNKFVKNPRTFYFSKTGHEKREIRPVSQASTLFKIFIFVQKINFDFLRKIVELFWVKTRGNAAVLDFLAVEQLFDFVKCWGFAIADFLR